MTITSLETYPHAYVAPADFAAYLAVSPRTIYHWIEKGALNCLRVEGTVRIPIEEARRFVKTN